MCDIVGYWPVTIGQDSEDDTTLLDLHDKPSSATSLLSKKRSDVWQLFEPLSDKEALCLECNSAVVYSGNTTNLTRHFKRKHPDKFTPANDKQPTVASFTCSSSRQIEINQDIAEWIALDGLPLSTIESERFRRILTKHIPGYKPICRKTLYENYILPLYKRTFLKIKEVFKDMWFSLTTDGWKARTTHQLPKISHLS